MGDSKHHQTCVICCRAIHIFAVGRCDHPVCFICSARMRVLCEQTECPICRQPMAEVYYTKKLRDFASVSKEARGFGANKKHGLFFDGKAIRDQFEELLDHVCLVCEDEPVYDKFDSLCDHMRRKHEVYFCSLCVEYLKLFTYERKTYNREELARHKRKGDPDDTSHRGHPLCEYCDVRYMDNDELFRHLRRDHFFSHFCDADGRNQFYEDYEGLRKHFKAEHYLCEEGSCVDEQFTSVFRTDIDFAAHKAERHSQGMSKQQAKQLRTLDLQFAVRPRHAVDMRFEDVEQPAPSTSSSRNKQRPANAVPEVHNQFNPDAIRRGLLGDRESSPEPLMHRRELDVSSVADFPSLSGGAAFTGGPTDNTLAQKLAKARGMSVRSGKSALTSNDFPSLPSSRPQATAVTAAPAANSLTNYNGSVSAFRPGTGLSKAAAAPVKPEAKKPKKPAPTTEDFPSLSSGAATNGTAKNWKPPEKPKKPEPPKKEKAKGGLVTLGKSARRMRVIEDDEQKRLGDSTPAGTVPSAEDFPSLAAKPPVVPKPLVKPAKQPKAKAAPKQQISEQNITLTDVASCLLREPKTSKKAEQSKKPEPEKKVKKSQQPPVLTETSSNKDKTKPAAPTQPVAADPPTKKPPPGFENVNPSAVAPTPPPPTIRPPPGFTAPVRAAHEFVDPRDYKERNERLFLQFESIGDKLPDFKVMSDAFRGGKLTAGAYYAQARGLLGDRMWTEVFPELLVLLPDIGRQGALLAAHNEHVETVGNNRESTAKSQFLVCATCAQVLSVQDFRDHTAAHNAS